VKAVFVAGTGTGVGKTVITGLLGRYLLEKGYRVVTQKWIQTGSVEMKNDIDTHLNFMGRDRADYSKYLPLMMPYEFKHASSPHLAARLEKRRISEAKIKKSLTTLSKDFDFIIIEGSGGLLVPIGGGKLIIDVVRRMRLPVLLVAGNRLGAINSTLLSIEALKARGMKIAGVIFNNNCSEQDEMILKDNPRIVGSIAGMAMLGTISSSRNKEILYQQFRSIGRNVEKATEDRTH